MLRFRRFVLCVALGVPLGGCAGQLTVYDAAQKEVAGIPFRAAEVYVKQGSRNRAASGGSCAPATFQELVSLPTGSQYYIKATTAAFAKTAFHIKYNDVGGVAEVGLDSEPAGAENIKAVSELIKTLAPLGGVALAERAKGAGVEPSKACDAGEENVTYEKLETYLARHPAP